MEKKKIRLAVPDGMELPEGVKLPEIQVIEGRLRKVMVGEDGCSYETEETIVLPETEDGKENVAEMEDNRKSCQN